MKRKEKENIFIAHPYLAMVIAIVITLCGVLGMLSMPVAQYPKVAPPQISVAVTYPGADAMTLLLSVIEPLEQQINGAPGLIYLDSTASESGQAVITATFQIGSDPERCTQLVQDRVNWALSQLPEAVQREGVIVRQQSQNILLAISFYSPGKTYDTGFISNFAAIHFRNRLQRIPGVSQIMLFGGSDYSMRIWVDPQKCASLKLPVADIINALNRQNLQVSSGAVGSAPESSSQRFVYQVRTQGRLQTPEEFGQIIVRARSGGAVVRLRDIAEIALGDETYSTNCTLNNLPAVMLLVFQDSNANALDISNECRRLLKENAGLFIPDLEYGFQYDSTNFVRTGIRDVVKTLITAVLLVAFVTYVFLQNWRMALVPTLAIPVSIVGSFAFLALLGYSINMVTLFALTLAIGIVVDDAIIVIENVSRLMEEEHLPPDEAAEKSMKQITGAIAATTAVLLAMFVPICFFSGITGELYRQFGVTISIAVALSALNALTLSPALSAIFLKAHTGPSRFPPFRWFNAGFSRISAFGGALLTRLLRFAAILFVLYLILSGAIVYLYSKLPSGFIPSEDQGYFFGAVQLPPGAALERTSKVTQSVSAVMGAVPGVSDVIAFSGYSVLTQTAQSNSSFVISILKPWDWRIPRNLGADRLLMRTQMELFGTVPEALCMLFEPPPIQGIGMAGGFNFVLQESTQDDPYLLGTELNRILGMAMQSPKLRNVFSDYNANMPILYLKVNREKALSMQVSLEAIDNVLENYLGFRFVNQFNRFGQVYKVELQAASDRRAIEQDLMKLHVENSRGNMVPMSSLATVFRQSAAGYLRRHNLHLSAEIQGSPALGYSSGQAMRAMEEIAKTALPGNMSYAWTDMSYQESIAGKSGPWIFVLAIVFIFLFLAALYGSWLLPWSVIPAIPAALGGALCTLYFMHMSNNLYTQIGAVLLFGMACKTAILIVDFAAKRHAEGESIMEGARFSARLRFRAVWMTSLAFILGTLPLALSVGAGAASQRSIGVPVVGGMIAVLFGVLLIIPVCYAVVQWLSDHFSDGTKRKRAVRYFLFWGLVLTLSGCYTPPPRGRLIEAKQLDAIPVTEDPVRLPPEQGRFSLAEAQEIALANNPSYLAAFSAITAARMRYYQAVGAYSPTISAGFAVGQQLYSGGSSNDYFPTQDNSVYTFSVIQANWVIFDGLAREFRLIMAKHNIAEKEFLSENAKRLLRQGVSHAYRELQRAAALRAIAESNAAFQREELHQAEIRFRTGDIAQSDVLTFAGQLNQAQMDVLKAKNQYQLNTFALAMLMGIPQGMLSGELEFSDTRFAEYETFPVEYYLDEALSHRPDLNAVREYINVMKYQHYQNYSAFSPVVSAFANYSYSSNSTANSGNNPTGFGNFYMEGSSFNYGGLATWQIFNGLIRYNQLRAGKAELDSVYLYASAAWQKIVNEVRGAYTDFHYQRERLMLARTYADIRRRERDLVQKEYRVGEVDILRFLQAQTAFINSENELTESQISQDKALTTLLSSSGLLIP